MAGNTPEATWDAARYDDQFGYVSAHGVDLVDWLAPVAGETVLDLGCGTGELAQRVQAHGASVIAVDSDPQMVAAASARLGSPAILADGHNFQLDRLVDAVFSNAALHWMVRPAEVLRCVHRSLRPHGRFVAEMGGARNVDTIITSVRAALAERGLADGMRVPWYFPSPAEYAGRLEAAGFRVSRMEYFPRPTPLVDCPNGIIDWVHMFGRQLVAHVPEAQLPPVLARAAELAEPQLRKPDGWYADYWRLRFVAVAESTASS